MVTKHKTSKQQLMSYQTRPWLPPHLAPVENTIREKSWRARCAASSQHRARTHAPLATTARSPDGRCSITARPRLRASKGQLQCKLLTTRAPRCFVLSARCHTQSDMNYLQLYQSVQLRCLEKEYIYSFMLCDQLYKCFIKFHTRYFGELTI